MTMMRIAYVVVVVALAGLACGSSGARAEESQSAASDFLKGLSKMAAKQTFTGTVVVKDTASGSSSTNDPIGKSSTQTSVNGSVVFTVTTNGVVANVTYASKTLFEQVAEYQSHRVVGTKTEETSASGTDTTDASVTVDLGSDGTYQINFRGGGVTGQYRMVDTAETICKPLEGSTCRPGTSSSEDSGKPPNQGGVAGSVDGRIDKKQPNVLVGSVTQRHEMSDGSPATRTVTWNLSR